MTRTRESLVVTALRRDARNSDVHLHPGVRLDGRARAHGYGTWSALFHA